MTSIKAFISRWAIGVVMSTGILCGNVAAADLQSGANYSGSFKDPVVQASPWFVRVGAPYLDFDSSAKLYLNGNSFAGASATAANNVTATLEFGYYLTDNISVMLSTGYPPQTSLKGEGTAAGLGTAGYATYGPAILSAQYHFDLGAIKPYVGGGLVYAIIFDAKDGSVSDLRVHNNFGAAVQGGIEAPLNNHWSLFADVRKLWLSVDIEGDYSSAPVRGDVTLDPVIVSAGVSYRF